MTNNNVATGLHTCRGRFWSGECSKWLCIGIGAVGILILVGIPIAEWRNWFWQGWVDFFDSGFSFSLNYWLISAVVLWLLGYCFLPTRYLKLSCIGIGTVGTLILVVIPIAERQGWLGFLNLGFSFALHYWLFLAIVLGLLGYGLWSPITKSLRKFKIIGGRIVTNLANWPCKLWESKTLKKWLLGLTILALGVSQIVVLLEPHGLHSVFSWLIWSPTVVAVGLLAYAMRNAITNLINRLATCVRSICSCDDFIWCLCERSWNCFWMVVFFVAGLAAALFLIARYCFDVRWCVLPICEETYYFSYFLFAIFLISVCMVCALSNEIWTHRLRKMDWSEVRALISDAKYRLAENEDKPERNQLGKKQTENIQEQIQSLNGRRGDKPSTHAREKKSPYTEYDVLALDQSLLGFYSAEELLARSDTLLNNLREYADDVERQYAREKFNRHEDKINHLKNKLESALKQDKIDSTKANRKREAEKLRAYLVELLEHIAGVDRYWFTGQAIARSLVVCSSLVSCPGNK